MMLTPIAREDLAGVLDRFAQRLSNPLARRVFARIRATSAERAEGAEAERHRQAALGLARALGIAVHPPERVCAFNWDGKALHGGVEAYVILHEAAHFILAPPARRRLVDFGLGPGPDTLDREKAEKAAVLSFLEREEDEALSSLLGILWEAALGQPALASFLDQNWLEGFERSAPSHFMRVLAALSELALIESDGAPTAIAPVPEERARRR